MSTSGLDDLSKNQKRRLYHIDFKVFFLGSIGRNDLVDRFGIKKAAATRDFSLYRNLAPDNLDFDTRTKLYTRSDVFEPLFDYSPNQVLSALAHGFGEDFVGREKGFIACETPSQLNRPVLSKLSVLTRGIYQQKVVKIEYRSLSSGRTTREIVPFVLVDNGLRWHVRAFDRRRSRFTDFVITRISNPMITDSIVEEQETREFDIQWNRIVELEIVAHPNLPHPETIETDYAMKEGVLNINVRAAVAGYVLRRWNVDCTENYSLRGKEYHLWLRNWQALYGVENLVLAPGYRNSAGEPSDSRQSGSQRKAELAE